jgi:menaquinone-dependent protoporphyrinogen oxidase
VTNTTRTDGTQESPASGTQGEVLLAYATRNGSTHGVASRIADALRKEGHRVELRAAEANIDASAYSAVILGSAVFNQRWLPEAEEFLHHNSDTLRDRPVWLFSVGTFGDSRRVIGPLMKREPKQIGQLQPRSIRATTGYSPVSSIAKQWPLPSRLLYHALGGHLGDNRDWHDIEAWADRIGHALSSTSAPIVRSDRARRRGPQLVLSSLSKFPGLIAHNKLRLPRERLGRTYRLCDRHSYQVFRETTRPIDGERPTEIEVGFRLKILGSAAVPHWLFQRLSILTTPFWSGFDGFGTKLWMVDPKTRSYAGIYEWRDADQARTYLRVLLPVLRAVSVPGSVFADTHPDAHLPAFLSERDPHRPNPGAVCATAPQTRPYNPLTSGRVSTDAPDTRMPCGWP